MIVDRNVLLQKDHYSQSFKISQDKEFLYNNVKNTFFKKTPFYLKRFDDESCFILLSRARNLTYGEEIYIEFGSLVPDSTNITITSVDLADITDKYFIGGFWTSLLGQGHRKHQKNVMKVYDIISNA